MSASTATRILYLDDLQDWRDQVGGLLRDNNYVVETVATADEFRGCLRSRQDFDLLIVDVRLNEQDENDMSGIALATETRDAGFQLPIVILTAYDEGLPRATLRKIGQYPYKFSIVGKGEWLSKSETGLLYQIQSSLPLDKRSLSCFVVMPFALEFDEVYSAIQETLGELNISCIRGDADHRAGYVPEKVRENLRRATFVIADLTERNPNVMYELGYAHAFRKGTILLCQNYDVDLPRELASFHAIRYSTSFTGIQQLEQDLRLSVQETLNNDTLAMPVLSTGVTCIPKTCAILASDTIVGQTARNEIILPVVQKLDLLPLPQEPLLANSLLVEQQWRTIQRASVVIAEISDGNPGVYYQVGVADALRHDCVMLLVLKDATPPFNLRGRANIVQYNPASARTARSAHGEVAKRLRVCLDTHQSRPAISPPEIDDPELRSQKLELLALISRFSQQADSVIQERFQDQQTMDRSTQSVSMLIDARQFVGERVDQYITAAQSASSVAEMSKLAHELLTYGPRWANQALNWALADLELRIALSEDKQTLTFILHNPGGGHYHHKPVGGTRLTSSPQVVLQTTFGRLSVLAAQLRADQSLEKVQHAVQTISDIGGNLYDELFPLEFKLEYRTLRQNYFGKSLLITTDEPWIPWEMVRPLEYDADGVLIYADPPLCETFQLARWVVGRAAPKQLPMKQAVLVRPSDNLKAAATEVSFFADLPTNLPGLNVIDPLQLVSGVQEAFREGSIHLFHFACHGNFDASDPNESKLKLSDGFLTVGQLAGESLGGLRRAKPFVFLNACHSGRRGYGLTRMGGWAQRFIECGACVFIGTQWEINDTSAAQFAVEFYQRLFGLNGHSPMMLGEAFREARLAIKDARPDDPTWLAFVLYGNPLAYVRIGASNP